jgi:hypothetical protein
MPGSTFHDSQGNDGSGHYFFFLVTFLAVFLTVVLALTFAAFLEAPFFTALAGAFLVAALLVLGADLPKAKSHPEAYFPVVPTRNIVTEDHPFTIDDSTEPYSLKTFHPPSPQTHPVSAQATRHEQSRRNATEDDADVEITPLARMGSRGTRGISRRFQGIAGQSSLAQGFPPKGERTAWLDNWSLRSLRLSSAGEP